MEEPMGTGDIIIGLLAGLGVLVLLVVFFFVAKAVLFSKDQE